MSADAVSLRWPADRTARFVDRRDDRVSAVVGVDPPLIASPGDTVDVSDADVADFYQSRGFALIDADGSVGDDSATESGDGDGFDVEAFCDRTPVADVVADIEAGDADGYLDDVIVEDDRVTVERAVLDRKDKIGDG